MAGKHVGNVYLHLFSKLVNINVHSTIGKTQEPLLNESIRKVMNSFKKNGISRQFNAPKHDLPPMSVNIRTQHQSHQQRQPVSTSSG